VNDPREGLLHRLQEIREDLSLLGGCFDALGQCPLSIRPYRFNRLKAEWDAKKQEEIEFVREIASLPPPPLEV
jgi:hypothetical protein